ncbi:MAG: redox-sensing transcriptional repressor Rex [Kiritimatiellae bacterium]|nr:redox-sensing transcriptional repressor Rex [Kiritimatiellia bacterium]MDD5523348.1 redox-sensing transcriptional repressor Rex [Kiritimatiellia bacterium]
MSKHTDMPQSVISRLTRYLAHIQTLCLEGIKWISSREIADNLGLTSSTVRQDLSYLDFSGVSKRGYETSGLEKVLTDVLGADVKWKMVMVGAGNLGKALALHEEFSRRGFNIVAIFDADKAKIGKKVGNLEIMGPREIPAVVAEKKVDIGVIAVPASAAQGVADMLIMSGVKGLLNLALTHIVAPRSVPVIDSRVVASLLELSHTIKFGRRSDH